MANMQAKSNAQDSQAKQGVQGFVPELNQEDFRNKWGYGGNPYMGYGGYGYPYMGYGYPYHHHGHFGYGFPYFHHHHHFPYGYHGMFGPYGGMNYPYTRGFDPAFYAAPYGANFQSDFSNSTGEFAQYPFQYPGFANNPYNSAVEQQPVANNVIQGTATPVRKQRSNGSSEFRSQKTSDEKTE